MKDHRPDHHHTPLNGFLPAVAGLALLLSQSLSGCRQPTAPAPPPPTVTVSLPLSREVTDWDEYTGHLVATDVANIAAQVSGVIVETPFKEGTLVKKGDVLFVIDDRPFKTDLDNKRAIVAKDEAQVLLTDLQLSRSEDLLKRKAIAQQDFDASRAAREQAKAQLAADRAAVETAELNLDWTRVTAKISGRVSRMNVTVGNLVNAGAGQSTVLTTIVSVDPMYCYVPVPEHTFLNYQAYARRVAGKTLRDAKIPCFIQLENEQGFPHGGFIDFIDNKLDTTTGTIQLRGVIPNPDGALTSGLFARMRTTGSAPYRTLLVPDLAVGTEQNERYLFVVKKDDTVASRKVKLGQLFGGLRSIVDGLKPDERVIVNGLQLVRQGAKAKPVSAPIPPESIAAMEASASGLASVHAASAPAPPPAEAAR
ncbi:MAG: efflux RND transporter periplasmic adaptor subunit [Chthoniobacteraceae bacterium]